MTRYEAIFSIIDECKKQGLVLNSQIAYVLATVEWETAHTFQPVRECFWKDEKYRRRHLRYWPYYGRGYVQITWRENYAKFGNLLNLDLEREPDLALREDVARFILVYGFIHGTFTGKKISDYINEHETDFVQARRCINGVDKAKQIAAIAEDFLKWLNEI